MLIYWLFFGADGSKIGLYAFGKLGSRIDEYKMREVLMFKLFLINLFRFLKQSLMSCVIAIVLAAIVNAIFSFLLNKAMSIKWFYGVGIAVGIVAGAIVSVKLSSADTYKDNSKYSPQKSGAVIFPLYAILLFVVAAVLCYKFCGPQIDALRAAQIDLGGALGVIKDLGVIVTALGVFTVFPVVFVIFMWVRYHQYRCGKCKHIFCIETSFAGSSERDYTQFKTETNREHVGEIKSGDTKIADVYGDVDTGYYRNVKETTNNYNCRCTLCGYEFQRSETSTDKGAWK